MKGRLRRHLLDRGHILATLLSEVLAAKPRAVLSATSLEAGKPGMRPEEKVRYALDQIERQRELLEVDDDRFGCCEMCGVELGDSAISEMPWADRCQAHAAR